MATPPARPRRLVAENRRARHEYEILDKVEAGLALTGSEVKSLRSGHGNIAEAFVLVEEGEAWLVDAHIPPYPQAGPFNHDPRRRRKLLLRHAELERVARRIREKGLTAVPLQLYFCGPWVKVELGVGRGRRLHDKRGALKEREDRRDMERALRRC